ncbi:MAG: hypothetical protein M1818_000385 [Claussenomyces sp. TS43310]|nr:MAG: hypothetical protein M1818_000385 [Claussenomyces sp. TS43310]
MGKARPSKTVFNLLTDFILTIAISLSAKVFHIPLIKVTPEFTLHSIVQRKPSPGSDASIDHPSAKIYTSAADMLADASIDLIVLTTPPNTHSPLARSALEAGKHVLVEKPFVPTAAEARELERLAAARQRLICVYQNRRWDADFLTFRRLQRDGALGRIVEFETHFDRWKPERPPTWKGTLGMADAGGVLYDLGTHLVDQVLVAFGVPRAVTGFFAHERNDGGPEPDAFTALLHYGPGAPLVTVKAGIMSAETAQLRYWVRGTKGSYKKFHLDVQEDQLKAGMLPGDEGFGVEHEDRAGAFTAMEGGTPVKRSVPNVTPETYGALYAAFAKAIEEGDEKLVPVKASEAGDVLRIIEAIQESAREGKTITL